VNRIITYSKNDLTLIFRDPILYVMLFVPLIFIGMLRIGLPALTGIFPGLEPFAALILATLCLVTSMFPAFIYSFILLDEKDQDVLTAIRVLPISTIDFIKIRLLFISLLSYLFIVIIISTTGILDWPAWKILLASIPISLIAPVTSLFITGFARNKIEGATWMKGLNFILFLPVLSYFVQGPYEYVLGILPVYWVFKLFDPGFSSLPFHVNYLIALLYHTVFLLAGVRIFRKRVFP
jgi:fluoroquinolone transport system permease protein